LQLLTNFTSIKSLRLFVLLYRHNEFIPKRYMFRPYIQSIYSTLCTPTKLGPPWLWPGYMAETCTVWYYKNVMLCIINMDCAASWPWILCVSVRPVHHIQYRSNSSLAATWTAFCHLNNIFFFYRPFESLEESRNLVVSGQRKSTLLGLVFCGKKNHWLLHDPHIVTDTV
jgi:hypothetical protein